MTELLYKQEVYSIVGAAMQVYNELGSGFLEAVYEQALEIELTDRGIPFEAQKELVIYYKGRRLKKTYVADFLVIGKIIVEIKATNHLTSTDEGQLLNYLSATGLEVGVLLNFGACSNMEWKRRIETRASKRTRSRTISEDSRDTCTCVRCKCSWEKTQ
ncbi:MAG: GxxExxY protein [Chloroflexi bacterium]|nr:GxxExxY protein [Chloroflexota bacterium]